MYNDVKKISDELEKSMFEIECLRLENEKLKEDVHNLNSKLVSADDEIEYWKMQNTIKKIDLTERNEYLATYIEEIDQLYSSALSLIKKVQELHSYKREVLKYEH